MRRRVIGLLAAALLSQASAAAAQAALQAPPIRSERTATSAITPYFSDIGFGGAWYASQALVLDETDEHRAGSAPFALITRSRGSRHNGPGNAAYGGFILSYKDDFLRSRLEGEVDGLMVNVRQGVMSDAAGILIDAAKVGDQEGGVLSLEASTARLAPSGETLNQVQSLVGFMESTVADGGDSGFRAEARVGQISAAYSATVHDSSGRNGAHPSFNWLFMGSTSRSEADRVFAVSGSGALQIGAGSSAIVAVHASTALLDFPTIPGQETRSLTLAMPGTAIGDHVTVSAIDDFGAKERLLFSGRVSQSDVVTVTAFNISPTVVPDPSSQELSIVATRYGP